MSKADVAAFVTRWKDRGLTERALAQSHFNDLCDLLGVPKPTENRETDSSYGFEVRTELPGSAAFAKARKAGGSDAGQGHLFSIVTGITGGSSGGYCDVWMEGHFCWEYKRPGKYDSLDAVFAQLNYYKNDLGNPPLLVASDIDTIEIRTNFTGFVPVSYTIHIDDLFAPGEVWRESHPRRSPIEVLRAVFNNPGSLCPTERIDEITEKRAGEIGELAKYLRDRGNDPEQVAHFLMQIVFCYFAEDAEFLPKGVLTHLFSTSVDNQASFLPRVRDLFSKMASGGYFGSDKIEYFNGGLFIDSESVPDFNIPTTWLGKLAILGGKDWSNIEPSIFGTLFERSLDPDKRSQIGAHYTSRDDIMLVIEPVILRPLRAEWREVQEKIVKELERRSKSSTQAAKKKANERIGELIGGFHHRLWDCKILDPACGSGNFLYVALQALMDLELEVRTFAARPEIQFEVRSLVAPRQLHGIEINTYACELARVSIWIGYLQWHRAHGDKLGRTPILEPLDTIENRDAILAWADERGKSIDLWREGAACLGQADWPEADYIVGNPPFLGVRQFRQYGLHDEYVAGMFRSFDFPNTSDLCCYWFEILRQRIIETPGVRGGLLATQGIRGRDSRFVLERIVEEATVFFAWSDRPWVLDGAAVHVSIIGVTGGKSDERVLDGVTVSEINADLTTGLRLTVAESLRENDGLSFQGPVKVGDFDIDLDAARMMLATPSGPSELCPLQVLMRFRNGNSLNDRYDGDWIIDFALMSMEEAAQFEAPFKHVSKYVKPARLVQRREIRKKYWWRLGEPNPAMRSILNDLDRFIATCQTAKHRIWCWLESHDLAGQTIIGIGRSDDYFFGVLHSSVHELWALRQGTQLEDRPRYTPTTCFETFPMPWPPGSEPGKEHAIHAEISAAAHDLNVQREQWLNPPAWTKPIEEKIDRFDKFDDVAEVSGEEARRLIRQSAIDAEAAKHPKLKNRTLTNLYNERPTWLALAHKRLDRAVLAAYRETDPEGEWDPDWAEVWKETGAGQPTPADSEHFERRGEIDQRVLANLLRLNLSRNK